MVTDASVCSVLPFHAPARNADPQPMMDRPLSKLRHCPVRELYRMHQMDLYGPVRGGVTWFADDLYRAVRPRIHLG